MARTDITSDSGIVEYNVSAIQEPAFIGVYTSNADFTRYGIAEVVADGGTWGVNLYTEDDTVTPNVWSDYGGTIRTNIAVSSSANIKLEYSRSPANNDFHFRVLVDGVEATNFNDNSSLWNLENFQKGYYSPPGNTTNFIEVTGVNTMAESRVTATVQSDSYAVYQVQGTGATIADARAELMAKLGLMTNIVVLKVSEAADVDKATYAAAVTLAGSGHDASFTLRKGTDRSTTRTVRMQNVSNALADSAAQDGSIDINNAAVTAFGAAYRDSSGAGGYTVIRAQLND